MTNRTRFLVVPIILAVPALPGCMPTMTIEEMKAMRPERPVELDELAFLEGRWEHTGEAKMAGLDRTLKSSGSSSNSWDNDRWCLLERVDFEMEELGKMKGLNIWTYDTKRRKYRTSWFDSYGATAQGTATYDESSKTWKLKAKGSSDWGTSIARGTMTIVDDNTIDWTWTEWMGWDCLRLCPIFEFKGTSRRK